MDMAALKDFFELGHLEVPKQGILSGASEPSSSPKLVKWFYASSVDPDHKKMVVLTIPTDARVLSPLVYIANYLCVLVTEDDHLTRQR